MFMSLTDKHQIHTVQVPGLMLGDLVWFRIFWQLQDNCIQKQLLV